MIMTENSKRHINPWAWVPSLYFAEGLPYVAVMTIAVILYKKMGISNTDIALYTGWLYLPWVIKPFWSPMVDLVRTKRWWIVTMQAVLAIAFAGIAFFIPAQFFFRLTLAFFWLVAFTSATHDIAADGFYMHGLDSHDQSFFVGIRSTFYRISTIAGQGLARHHRGTDRGPYGQDTALLDGGLRHPLHPLLPREPLPRLGAPQTCLRPATPPTARWVASCASRC